MDSEGYRRRLQDLEKRLAARIERETQHGRDEFIDVAADSADVSTADVTAAVNFAEGELDSTVLSQVREALDRIDAGTFGRCIVDDGPIEAARLEAVPWTPYCLKHQELAEEASPKSRTR